MAEGLEESIALDESAQILHLCTVGRDDTYVDLLVEDTLLADLGIIVAQRVEREQCLAFVDASEALTNELLTEVGLVGAYFHVRRVDPLHRYVVVEDATVGCLWCAFHLTAIEPVGAEAHDGIVHAVLYLQE